MQAFSPLEVEIGRYRNTPLYDRICTLCDQGVVEDEFHLLCLCNKYTSLRETLYEKASDNYQEFNNLDDLDKFVYLVNNTQRPVIKFLVDALSMRSRALFTT